MKSLFYLFILLIAVICPVLNPRAAAEESVIIKSSRDIPPLVKDYNYDLKLLAERIREAQASLLNLQGQYFYPELKTEFNYLDDRQQPNNPFQPARVRDFFWEVKAEQKLPQGVTTRAGVSNLRSTIFQSDPPNPLLPYPADFNQPVVFLKVSVDVLQDLLGYITRKEIKISLLDYDTAVLTSILFRHKMTVSAINLFLQTINLQGQEALRRQIIKEFSRLRGDLQNQLSRSIGEKGDLDRVNRLIATAETDIIRLKKNRDVVVKNLENILGISGNSQVLPQEDSLQLLKRTQECEKVFLASQFSPEFSREFDLLNLEKSKGDLNAKIFRRKRLPNVSIEGGVSTTGTDPNVGSSFNEVVNFDRPIYSAGVKFSWPLSPLRIRAANQAAIVSEQTPSIDYDKILHERKLLWEETQGNIRHLQKEYQTILKAIQAGKGEVSDLISRFDQGRVSLFQLSESRIELFRLQVVAESLKFQRTQNLLETLQLFDQFQCPLLPMWHS